MFGTICESNKESINCVCLVLFCLKKNFFMRNKFCPPLDVKLFLLNVCVKNCCGWHWTKIISLYTLFSNQMLSRLVQWWGGEDLASELENHSQLRTSPYNLFPSPCSGLCNLPILIYQHIGLFRSPFF